MKAKDTVMSYESVEQMLHTPDPEWVDKGRNIAETQAEISFKAGKQDEYKRWIKAMLKEGIMIASPEQLRRVIRNLKQEGAREVIEKLIKSGQRAGNAQRMKLGIKASASDGYLWFLGDIADKLFEQMKGKNGYLVFIENP